MEEDARPVFGSPRALSGSNATTASVPALSEWGMFALIGLLVLSGAWMIRRRQRLTST